MQTNKRKFAFSLLEMLLCLAFIAMVVAPLARAIELTAPPNVLGYVGRADKVSPTLYRSESFLPEETVLAVTNSASGILITNDFGCTNNFLYKRVAPNSGSGFFTNSVYVTNSTISPYFWQLDGTNAIYVQSTGVPGWGDVPLWTDLNGAVVTNVALSLGITGLATTTTNAGTVYVAKSGSGRYYDITPADLWTVNYGPLTGTNTWSTNAVPPPGWLAGVKSLRAYQVVSGTNAVTSTNWFSEFRLVGWGR